MKTKDQVVAELAKRFPDADAGPAGIWGFVSAGWTGDSSIEDWAAAWEEATADESNDDEGDWESDYPYHVEVHTRRAGCHLEDVCDDYKTLDDAVEAAAEMSKDFADNDDCYCQVTLAATGTVVEQKSCREWVE